MLRPALPEVEALAAASPSSPSSPDTTTAATAATAAAAAGSSSAAGCSGSPEMSSLLHEPSGWSRPATPAASVRRKEERVRGGDGPVEYMRSMGKGAGPGDDFIQTAAWARCLLPFWCCSSWAWLFIFTLQMEHSMPLRDCPSRLERAAVLRRGGFKARERGTGGMSACSNAPSVASLAPTAYRRLCGG